MSAFLRRRTARDARQGRDAKRRAEGERAMREFMARGAAAIDAGAKFWPPITPEHEAELRAEDRAEKALPKMPHKFVPLYWQPRSICVWCKRPKKAHWHYSTVTYQDVFDVEFGRRSSYV